MVTLLRPEIYGLIWMDRQRDRGRLQSFRETIKRMTLYIVKHAERSQSVSVSLPVCLSIQIKP